MKKELIPRSLSVQMILSFLAVVGLTAVATGIPAIWLLQNQMESQAWSQVAQDQQTSQALFQADMAELHSAANLTAQRPTLARLLSEGDGDDLHTYLNALQTGTGVDGIFVCDPQGGLLVSTEVDAPGGVCTFEADSFEIVSRATGDMAWYVARQAVQQEDALLATIVVVRQWDNAYLEETKTQTGLDYILWQGKSALASSFTATGAVENGMGERMSTRSFQADGQLYYAANYDLVENALWLETALNVQAIRLAQRRLDAVLVFSITATAVVVAILGVLLARRMSKPLELLAKAAEKLRGGDLQAQVDTNIPVEEIAQVAQALEGARVDLAQILTRLEQEKNWINNLLDSIVEGVVALDSTGKVLYFSSGAEKIMLWERGAVLDKHCDDVFNIPNRDVSFLDCIPEPGGRRKLDVVLGDGQLATLSISGAQLTPSEVNDAHIAFVLRDVSEEEVINRLIGQFLANISHEFRTPLSALAASTELLRDQAAYLSKEELQQLIEALHLSTVGLQTLIDNLLETASIEAGHFRVSPMVGDLKDIIADAVDLMQPLIEKHSQQLVINLPIYLPGVRADHRRIVQVLVNLLSNASKYGPDHSTIMVEVKLMDSKVQVRVIDQGPGISTDHRKQLFHRFMQTGTPNEYGKEGAGLGLSVVKAIVEAHGGEAGIADNPQGGSIFWFTLVQMEEA
ncbi:MAG: HAMP domain-containing protein [Anaerolineales bacterium]|nr:HAMP domain-containing protein [Anaerolineales bacterium]